MSSRKVLLGIAAVAVIAIGYFAVQGYPPVGPGSEGTVGAAKKYQSEQITAKDVTLQNPEVQRVLQSDVFHKLVTNPETRAILTSKDFQKAMAAAEVRAFMAQTRDASVGQVLDSALDAKAVSGLLSYLSMNSEAGAAVDAALRDPAVEKAFDRAASKASEKAIDRASEKALDQALGIAIQDAGLEKLLIAAAHDPAFVQLLGNSAFQEALQHQVFAGLLADPAFGKALDDKAFRDGITNAAFLEAAKGGVLGAAIDAASDAAAGAASGAAVERATDAAQGKAQDGAQHK